MSNDRERFEKIAARFDALPDPRSTAECVSTLNDTFDTLLARGCRKEAWEHLDECGKKLRNSIPRPERIA